MGNLILLEQLKGYLREQISLYKEMQVLSSHQRQSIEAEDFEALDAILKKKEEVIDKIMHIQKDVARVRQEIVKAGGLEHFTMSSLSRCYTHHDISSLQELLDGMTEVMEKLLEAEKTNEELLCRRMELVKAGMAKVRKGKVASKAYGRAFSSRNSPAFVDKKG